MQWSVNSFVRNRQRFEVADAIGLIEMIQQPFITEVNSNTSAQKGSSGTATSRTCEAKFPSQVSGKVHFPSEKFLCVCAYELC